ncbi:MAG: IPT/TIG domain-containing protein [bacterium]
MSQFFPLSDDCLRADKSKTGLTVIVTDPNLGAPAIASFQPLSGPVGTTVTILGNNFDGITDVTFNSMVSANFSIHSNNEITAVVPQNANSGPIVITGNLGSTASADDFILVLPPIIRSFTPASGVVGTEVTFTGENFTEINDVLFNGISATQFTVDSPTHLRARLPHTASSGPVSIGNSAGLTVSTDDFIVTLPPPTIVLRPSHDTFVRSNRATKNYGNSMYLTVRKSASAVYASYLKFEVSGITAPPQNVTLRLSVTDSGPEGGFLYLVSNKFAGSNEAWTEQGLMWNNAPPITGPAIAVISAVTAGQTVEIDLTGVIQAQGTYSLTVQNSSSDAVKYSSKEGANPPELIIATGQPQAPVPVIASFHPLLGQAGIEITISGSNFNGTTAVAIGGVDVSVFSIASDTQIRALVPQQAGTGKIRVSTPEGTATSMSAFTVIVAPTITSFSPARGPVGTSITILGDSFEQVSDVALNGVTAPGFEVISKTELLAVVPAGARTGKVSVQNSAGTATSVDDFTVTFIPAVRSFRPDSAAVATEVTLSGLHFTGATAVAFNGTAAPGFLVDSDTQLRAVVPGGATTGVISVTNADGVGVSGSDFAVIEPPVVTSLNPASGSAGSDVTLIGSGFTTVHLVSFNGVAANFVKDSDAQMRATVPATAATGLVTVTNLAGSASSNSEFQVTTVPVVSSFSPAAGVVGDEVTLTGLNFTGTVEVAFNGTPAAAYTRDSDTQLRATVPSGATTGVISVTNSDGAGSSSADFTVIVPAAIVSMTPNSGPPATVVTVTGSGFDTVSEVFFNGTPAASFTVENATRLRAEVPVGALSGPVSVTNPAGTSTSATDFTVTSAPSAMTFTPAEDTYVRSNRPGRNYGNGIELYIRQTSASYIGYLKFVVSGISGVVQSAKIRLKVTSSSDIGGGIYLVSNDYSDGSGAWAENGLIWDNAPGVTGPVLSSLGRVKSGEVVEFDVTSALGGNGTFSFAIKNSSSDAARYSTKEGSSPPELRIDILTTPVPVITGFTPDSAAVATEVTLSGLHFTGATAVAFNGTAAPGFLVDSDTQLRAVVPGGATTGVISVTNADGVGVSGSDFAVIVPGGPTLSLTPISDAFVRSSLPDKNYFDNPELRLRKSRSAYQWSYLKFDISGLTGTVQSATLKFYVTDGGSNGGGVYSVSNTYAGTADAWDEANLTWNNAPDISGPALSSLGPVTAFTTVELDVTTAISSNGIVSFALKNGSLDVVKYASKESSNPPKLVIKTSTASPSLAKGAESAAGLSSAEEEAIPLEYVLGQNYPNPFNPSTSISFAIPRSGTVKLMIYNLRGRLISTIVSGRVAAGRYKVEWDGTDSNGANVASGLYVYRLQAWGASDGSGKSFVATKKLVLTK